MKDAQNADAVAVWDLMKLAQELVSGLVQPRATEAKASRYAAYIFGSCVQALVCEVREEFSQLDLDTELRSRPYIPWRLAEASTCHDTHSEPQACQVVAVGPLTGGKSFPHSAP